MDIPSTPILSPDPSLILPEHSSPTISSQSNLTPATHRSLPPSPDFDPTDTLNDPNPPLPFLHAEFDIDDVDVPQKRDGHATTRRIDAFLKDLRKDKISPIEVLIQALDPNRPGRYREKLYREADERISNLIDTIMADAAGKRKLQDCLRPHVGQFSCDIVAEQMETRRKASIIQGIEVITPEFIENWNLDEEEDLTPFLTNILETAAQTEYAAEHNKIKHPQKLCKVVTRQLLYQSSNRCLAFQGEFGLFLWATGSAKQTIDAVFRCGLSVSYDSVGNLIKSLALHCDSRAISFCRPPNPIGFNYDNVNVSGSIFVEQRGSAGPAKVQSGTFGIMYRLRNASLEDMLIAPMMRRFKTITGLQFNRDIRPTVEQLSSAHDQLVVIVIDRLIQNSDSGLFEYVAKDPLIFHKILRAIPVGYISEQCAVRASTTEEATVRENLLFHDEIFVHHLKRTREELSKYAIPGFHDQLTNARIRAAQIMRSRDVDAWSRREVFQLGFGLFHLCLNLVWAILHIHRGTINETGSLAYFFALMEKKRLGNDQPDYHTLLAALTQILDGLLLDAWRRQCGFPTLAKFAETKPPPAKLREIAASILTEYATAMPSPTPPPPSDSESDSESDNSDSGSNVHSTAESTTPSQADPDDDIAHQNIRLLIRDLLVLVAVVRAISDGDIGRVEVFFPHLAMMFRGAGCNKYSTELLHFMLNLKYVWTPKFANIMRDNMIVCFSGRGPGHCMAVDLNIEHIIGYLKNLLKAKGMESTWDRLGNISAAIVEIQRVKKKISSALEASHKSTRHTTPDTSNMVKRVQHRSQHENLLVYKAGRQNNDRRKLVCDIQASGEAKLKSSTLGTFNKKVLAMVAGIEVEEEVDDCPAMDFAPSEVPDDV
ncbi:hypothetical protein C8R43DRAFT_900517 [Mycena crocata]|nr:hypothetical protein C8R43DRAFT_900517 [Mycena crocata]